MLGGGGGVAPLQKMFNLLGPPHGSLALPEQAMSQSVDGSETFPVKELPQSTRRISHFLQIWQILRQESGLEEWIQV